MQGSELAGAAPTLAAERENDPTAVKPVSPWLTIPLILLCLGGGGWMLHWYITAGDLDPEMRLLDEHAVFALDREPNAPPPIQQQDPNSWAVRGREAVAIFSRPAANQSFSLRSLSYVSYQFVPQDQRNMIFAARRLGRDVGVQKALHLTPQQVKQLRGMTAAIGVTCTHADQTQLLAAWNAYEAATPAGKPAAERQLLLTLERVAQKSVEPTRNAAAARAAKIKPVLSEAQWKQFDALGR